MRITLESTDLIENVQGVPARVWHGETSKGIKIQVWIPLIQCARDQDQAELAGELRELEVRRELVSFDMRMVI